MKMAMSGKVIVNAPVDTALKFLTNLREIAMCVPTARDFNQIDDKNLTIKITLSIAFVNGVFEVKETLVEQSANRLVYNIEGRGIGSTIKETLTLDINPEGTAATELAWNADVELGGIVSGLSESVLRRISEDNVNEIITNVKARLEGRKQEVVQ